MTTVRRVHSKLKRRPKWPLLFRSPFQSSLFDSAVNRTEDTVHCSCTRDLPEAEEGASW